MTFGYVTGRCLAAVADLTRLWHTRTPKGRSQCSSIVELSQRPAAAAMLLFLNLEPGADR